ncbi:MAG: hypothetical protein WCF12_04950 [Propionicimonas sp.]
MSQTTTAVVDRTDTGAELLRAAASRSYVTGDFAAADAGFEELHRAGALEPGDAHQWVDALRQLGSTKEPPTLQELAAAFPDDQDIVEFVAAELWQRAVSAGASDSDAELARHAWSAAVTMAAPGPRSDDEGVRLIGLLDRFYEAGKKFRQPIGSATEFENALLRFAAAGPKSALRAADLLAGENPGLAVELIAHTEASASAVLVSAVAACGLDDFAGAVFQFDSLAQQWGVGVRELDLEDRSHWIQAMTDVGRFSEADDACLGTLAALDGHEPAFGAAWPVVGLTLGSADHWRHVYRLLGFRLASQQGRFLDAWGHLRASQAVDESVLEPNLQRSILRVRLLLADSNAAIAILDGLESLDADDPYETTYVEACLWAGAQWGSEPGPLSQARYRGQAAARALLVRAGPTVSSRQLLRLALLAGDDDRAARMLAAEPLTPADPWTVKVLAAMLLLRLGDDAGGRTLLDEVLPQRRHDLDLRVLDAQASLIAGRYKAALQESLALTEAVGEHVLALSIQAEAEFEAALAMVEDSASSVENVQQLMAAVADYRRAADLHAATKHFLRTGKLRPHEEVGSEPLLPRLFAEVCRRGLHAAILAQEGLDRLGLRGDARLVNDAQDLVQHLRSISRPCCRDRSGSRGARLLHQIRHLPDRDEASRLAMLMISYRWSRWMRVAQNLGFFAAGTLVAAAALMNYLPGPESDTIRVTVFALGVLLMLMPFARSLKVGVLELSRDAEAAPLSGRSKSLRTSRVLLRSHQVGTFSLPSPPDKGRRAHQAAQQVALESVSAA